MASNYNFDDSLIGARLVVVAEDYERYVANVIVVDDDVGDSGGCLEVLFVVVVHAYC